MIHWLLAHPQQAHPDWACLTVAERRAAAAIGHPRRRLEWCLGRASSKHLIRSRIDASLKDADIEILSAPSGQPQVRLRDRPAQNALVLSIAHTAQMAFVALSRKVGDGLGVDLEAVTDRAFSVRRHFCSRQELRFLSDCDPSRAALLATVLWSIKEAAYKTLSSLHRPAGRLASLQVELAQGSIHGEWNKAWVVTPNGPLQGFWTFDEEPQMVRAITLGKRSHSA